THPFRVPTASVEEELPKMLAEREGAPPRLRPLNPAVSSGLEAIVRKCLEPDPARRYQSAGDLRDDLDRHRADLPLSHVRVPSVRERVRKWARRHPRLTSNLSLGTAAAVALGVCVAGLVARDARIKRVEAEAVAQQERYGAETAAREVGDDLKAAHYLLSSRPPEPEALASGAAKCEAALARYGLPADDGGLLPVRDRGAGRRAAPRGDEAAPQVDRAGPGVLLGAHEPGAVPRVARPVRRGGGVLHDGDRAVAGAPRRLPGPRDGRPPVAGLREVEGRPDEGGRAGPDLRRRPPEPGAGAPGAQGVRGRAEGPRPGPGAGRGPV